MSSVKISGNASGTGTFTIASPNSNTDRTITLPDNTGTILTTGSQIEFGAGTVSAPSISTSGDTNTGIFFPTADTIAFAEGGVEAMRINSSGNVGIGATPTNRFHVADNSASAMIYGLQSGAGDIIALSSGASEKFRITNAGNVGIGTDSPSQKLHLAGGSNRYMRVDVGTTAAGLVGGESNLFILGYNTVPSLNNVLDSSLGTGRLDFGNSSGGYIAFLTGATNTAPTERARITSGGDLLIGKTTNALATAGIALNVGGNLYSTFTRNGGGIVDFNRTGDDGELVAFYQDGTKEGSISVSGATVSYNAFSGSHWSQLQQGRGYNPDIPRGTVMSSIGEMCEWKSVTWTETIEHPAVPAIEAKEAVLDEEGNVIEPAVEAVEGKDAWTETNQRRENYLGNLAVGATFTEDGVTKTVVDDGNERLPKVKISDVVGDKAVYGVFQTWDEVQDMLVTSLGAFVVRIAAGVTVQIGDLLESNGDGCAKVQDDDVIRSKTIGKVTSTTPSATYADGSYTVPAVLYCG